MVVYMYTLCPCTLKDVCMHVDTVFCKLIDECVHVYTLLNTYIKKSMLNFNVNTNIKYITELSYCTLT